MTSEKTARLPSGTRTKAKTACVPSANEPSVASQAAHKDPTEEHKAVVRQAVPAAPDAPEPKAPAASSATAAAPAEDQADLDTDVSTSEAREL